MTIERNIEKEIEHLVSSSKVVLFMKGTPSQPACGFSARAVSLLKANGVSTESFLPVNILADEEMRQGVKKFSNWPTVPQLYVNKEFIGGSDIMTELHNSGELKQILEN